MASDLEEQETLDVLKNWCGRYGMRIVIFVAVVILAWGSWRGWQAYQSHLSRQAMGYFEALQTATRDSGAAALAHIKVAVDTLRDKYPNTGYAARGVLIAAQALQAQHDIVGARAQLEWLAAQHKDMALQSVAKLRLAGLWLDQKQYDAALAQLQDFAPPFAALFADRRGDILAAQGKRQEARAAWQSAIHDLEPTSALVPVVRLKLDALSGGMI